MDTRQHDAVCESPQVRRDIGSVAELVLAGSCFKHVGSVTTLKPFAYDLKNL